MLAFYNRLAKRLYGLRPILWALGALAVGAFGSVLFLSDGSINSAYALLSVTVLLWSAWLLAVAHSFAEPPPMFDPAARIWTRFKAKLKLGLVWAHTLIMTALFLLALVMTIRTTGIVLGGYG